MTVSVPGRGRRSTATGTRVPFRIHPRAFKALGADLVTNDVVAIIELVKNAYDAYATNVDIRFGTAEEGGQYIEIQDDGSGMGRDVIEDAWFTVATPYRRSHPLSKRPGKRARRASGAKGLGRLSAARLGARLEMLTQSRNNPCWRVEVDWAKLSDSNELAECYASVERFNGRSPFKISGTLIRVVPLRTHWHDSKIDDLRDNLARLLTPFATADDFAIRLTVAGSLEPVRIEPPPFLEHPKYMIRGDVDGKGNGRWFYEFHSITGGRKRKAAGKLTWSQVKEQANDPAVQVIEKAQCGPFNFEIRAWDIAPQDTQEISERFELKRSTVRSDIRAYKGISVYRDGVLVLPKSEGARDWLGLDLRRVGRVGPRLSTPQIVGYVSITADKNPRIEDTSDRERLAATPAVTAFEEILRSSVSVLENEREKDRRNTTGEKKVVELFDKLSAKQLVADVSEVAAEGGSAADTLPFVRDFSVELEQARQEIETRFIYYSRLATVGTIAQMLVHEVRNRTTVIGSALQALQRIVVAVPDQAGIGRRVELASNAVAALEKLADTFAPLANRSFRRRMRTTVLEESVLRCLAMLDVDLKARKVQPKVPSRGATIVAIDPGELDAVLLNLFTNSLYWLGQVDESKREIEVRLSNVENGSRVRVSVHDSGPGVPEADSERIFWPGVTNKPAGIGMGLTVAAELVAEHGGKLGLVRPGKLGGASFVFDLPLKAA